MENKVDATLFMNDQMKAVLAKSEELVSNAFDSNAGFEEMRKNYVIERAFWNEDAPEMARVVERDFDGPAGTFMARYYYPTQEQVLPAIEFMHGGGFVVGCPDTHDRVCRLLAAYTGAAVVSVDYHLSPESKFPVNIQECVVVAQHLHEHGSEEGIDGDDISFAGDSGGAVLSLAADLWLRDECGDNSFVKSLLLYYGFYGLTDSVSQRLYGWEFDGMRKEDLLYYNQCWLNDYETESKSPYVDMLHNDLSHDVAPCYIAAAALDPLRDDSACLHAVLDSHGVKNQFEVFEGVLHAFIHYSRMLDASDACIRSSAEFWKARNQA